MASKIATSTRHSDQVDPEPITVGDVLRENNVVMKFCVFLGVHVLIIVLFLGPLWPRESSLAAAKATSLEFDSSYSNPISDDDIELYREDARKMFIHGYDGYMRNAFPHDELKPLSGSWTDSLAELGNLDMKNLPDSYNGIALSLIESLSTLAVMGNSSEFSMGVRRVLGHITNFDLDVRVNVFEANIRVVGGLLSAHILASDHTLELMDTTGAPYTGQLLALARDMAARLLPAFKSKSGVPYAWVNLQKGVLPQETTEQNTAGAGTFMLEFGTLSALTDDTRFVHAARAAMQALWKLRSPIGLLGNTLNVETGVWIHPNAGIGGGSDSFFEYVLKCYVLFADLECWKIFSTVYGAIRRHAFKQPWYVEVSMLTGKPMYLDAQGLAAFWPALNVLVGDLAAANMTHRAFFQLWKRYGVLPERHSLATDNIHHSEKYYLLRPELAESTYYLYKATRDPFYLHVGREIWESIESLTRTEHGYASLRDVTTKEKEDRMCSFFLAETCKYLFLLFDTSPKWDRFVFNTEGHMLRIAQLSNRSVWHAANATDPIPIKSLACPVVSRAAAKPAPAPPQQPAAPAQCTQKKKAEKGLEKGLDGQAPVTACHVLDKHKDHRCKADTDCGVDALTCKPRKCSGHFWCTTG